MNADTGERVTTHLDIYQNDIVAPIIGDIGPAVEDWWNVNVTGANAEKARHFSDIELVEVQLRRIFPLEPVILIYNVDPTIPGTGTGSSTSPQDVLLVSLRTAKVGRSYRGRMYLPAPATSTVSSPGFLDEATAEECGIAMAGLMDQIESGFNGVPCVWSPTLETFEQITTIKVDRRIRTQRRRAAESTVYVTTPA